MANKLEKAQKVLDEDRGKFLLAYKVKGSNDVRRGLPIFKTKWKAEKEARRLSDQIDAIIECWAEAK